MEVAILLKDVQGKPTQAYWRFILTGEFTDLCSVCTDEDGIFILARSAAVQVYGIFSESGEEIGLHCAHFYKSAHAKKELNPDEVQKILSTLDDHDVSILVMIEVEGLQLYGSFRYACAY